MEEWGFVVVVVMTVVSSLAGVVGILPAMFSPMMLAAPGSQRNPATLALVFSLIAFPLVCLVSVILSWSLYSLGSPEAAGWVALLPIANLALAGVALTCLQVFYQGNFRG